MDTGFLHIYMDPRFTGLPDSVSSFKVEDEFLFSSFQQSQDFPNNYLDGSLPDFMGVPLITPSPDSGYFPPPAELDSPDDQDADPVLKYLNQILLEENIDEKPSMFHDPIALKAAEKSFYEALAKGPPSPYQSHGNYNTESPDSLFGNSCEPSTSSSTFGSSNTDPLWIVEPEESKSSFASYPPDHFFHSSFETTSERSNGSLDGFGGNMNVQMDSLSNANVLANIFTDTESILQFKRGMEEASKFLPASNQLVIDLDQYSLPPKTEELPRDTVIKSENSERDSSHNSSRGKKHHHLEDDGFEEERSSKQSAVYVEEELSELFDKVLLCNPNECVLTTRPPEVDKGVPHNVPNSGKSRSKKQGATNEAVDLRTLLISCAQSVAADDRRTANEQLKQIRQHSSPNGDANQRLANVFANGLEARLAGTGTQLYAALAPKRITAFEKLKAYQVYMSACPFKKIAMTFANKMIHKISLGAPTLHVIDFGILYGFQWPILIQHLSSRPGGPPKLRVTGIDLPQPGFRPAEMIEETGRRLGKYCERFGVPFEYNAIATQNWETIKIEDLKLVSGEVVAVNCLYRFKNLLDETVAVDSPRDAVLSLIRKINPSIFVHAVINGSYSAPFFVTRFREALFHFSALFDMFDATIPRDDQHRFHFEQEFYGRETLNVIACEGVERVERAETYKQWQVRTMRAGFKLLPLNPELMTKLREKKAAGGYHRDFLFDEDGKWMLQGWKGRIICASACWVPA
nr:scarecrow-like protein 14 [Ipomoea batatas]